MITVINLIYKKSLTEIEKYLAAHRKFLDTNYKKGVFLASGPKTPRDGGIIIALGDKQTFSELVKQDPFYQHDIVDYQLTTFNPVKHHHILTELL